MIDVSEHMKQLEILRQVLHNRINYHYFVIKHKQFFDETTMFSRISWEELRRIK